MRGTTLGRKNDLFDASDTSSDWIISIYTIMPAAKFNNVNPQTYLHGTLTKIAGGHPFNRIGELIP